MGGLLCARLSTIDFRCMIFCESSSELCEVRTVTVVILHTSQLRLTELRGLAQGRIATGKIRIQTQSKYCISTFNQRRDLHFPSGGTGGTLQSRAWRDVSW